MRVLFCTADLNHGQAQGVWRSRGVLRERYGIELATIGSGPAYDLALVHTTQEDWPTWLKNDRPLVLLERIDGPQLTPQVRKHLAHPKLKAVIKNTIFADGADYNQPWWRKHELTCRIAMGDDPELPWLNWHRLPPISVAEYGKLKLGFSFTAYPHNDPLRFLEPYELSGPRPYTCHFAGTTDYGPELPWLNWHRRCAVDAIRRFPNEQIAADHRAMQFPEYFKTLRQSEFVVSPWGLGEPCYRDFEAVLCGCMVIKPPTQDILTVPRDFYSIPQIKRYVCKPDFSDLEDIVANAERVDIGDRIHWARWLSDSNSPASIARRLAGIFKEALGG